MTGYRKVKGEWVKVDALRHKEYLRRARCRRLEALIQAAEHAKVKLEQLRASCDHEVVTSLTEPIKCVICGSTQS